ncbi:MAG: BrnT family toxin [Candidatus Riflebacteria bacterium]|nr:BrnT family toxin [Candidatus Riflebacteria bacterium]
MNYEWDESKRALNLHNHGVDFMAVHGFMWEWALITPDLHAEYGEARFMAVSFIGDDLFTLVYANRGESIRVISLRQSTNEEKRLYAKDTQ